MKHILNQFFDKVFCIVRTDQYDNFMKMKERFETLGIEVEYWYGTPMPFYSLLKTSLIALENPKIDCRSACGIGATLSHLSIIKLAKDLKLNNVFIFEHQNMFRKDFNSIIDKYINSIPKDFDIVYLFSNFWNFSENNQWVVDNLWFTSYKTLHNNAYGINSKFFDVLLNYYENSYHVIDLCTYLLSQNDRFKFLSSYPNLCSQEIQFAGTSEDVSEYFVNVFDYNPNFGNKTVNDFF